MKNEIASEIKEIAKIVTLNNIEVKLFEYMEGKYKGRQAIRSFDLDAGEVVMIRIFATKEKSQSQFAKTVENLKFYEGLK